MNNYTVRRILSLCAVAGGMAMAPAESQAIFHWFGCGSCGTPQTSFRPVAPTFAAMPVASSCNTCSPCAQTCNYMPQTCFRTVMQQVPVTTFQPVAACDPCGNRTTVMRPVVTFQTQARLVPYTTFRPVWGSTASFAPSPCASGNCGTSVSFASPMSAAPGCSSCASGSSASFSSAPAATFSTPAPTYSTPGPTYSSAPAQSLGTPGSSVQSLTPTPALQPSEPTRPQTFQDDRGVTEGESRLRPIPDTQNQNQSSEPTNKKTNSTLTPRLLDSNDRTTYRPLKYNVIPVAAEEAEEAEAELENDGWRPARR